MTLPKSFFDAQARLIFQARVIFQSLEDKLSGKISAIKSYLLDQVYDLKNELKV